MESTSLIPSYSSKPGTGSQLPLKSQMVNTSGFGGQTVAITQLCCGNIKIAIDNKRRGMALFQ